MDDMILLRTDRLRGVEIDVERRVARVAGGLEVGGGRPDRLRARPSGAARLDAGRQRRRLLARRRGRLVRPQARAVDEQRHRDRARHRRRPAAARRPRERARAVLGAPRRRRQLRRRHGARGAAVRDPRGLRRRPVLPVGALCRGAARVARLDADGARGGHLGRPDPPVPAARRSCPSACAAGKFAVVEAVFIGSETEGAELLAPLRALGPAMDTFAMVPPVGIAELHMDPPEPVPYTGEGMMLGELDAAAIDALRRGRRARLRLAARLGRDPPPRRRARTGRGEGHGALATFDSEFLTFGARDGVRRRDLPGEPAAARRPPRGARPRTTRAGSTSTSRRTDTDAATFYRADAYRRLRAVKAEVDPEDVFRANHPIAPASRGMRGRGPAGRGRPYAGRARASSDSVPSDDEEVRGGGARARRDRDRRRGGGRGDRRTARRGGPRRWRSSRSGSSAASAPSTRACRRRRCCGRSSSPPRRAGCPASRPGRSTSRPCSRAATR